MKSASVLFALPMACDLRGELCLRLRLRLMLSARSVACAANLVCGFVVQVRAGNVCYTHPPPVSLSLSLSPASVLL